MVTAFDVEPAKLINKVAEDMKAKIKMPVWAKYAKTGCHVERVPSQKDWFYLRAASLLRKIYIDGPVGVERLRSAYGGRVADSRGITHTKKAGGKIIRTLLQQLEENKLIKKSQKGREISPAGRKYLDNTAFEIKKHKGT